MHFIFQGSYNIQFLLYLRVLVYRDSSCELCLVCLLSSIWTCVLSPVKWLSHHSTLPLLFFNKDYTKSCAFVSFHWSAPGGYCDPERSRRSPASAECNPHQERGPVHEQNTHEQLLSPPEIRRPVAPVADWRVFCRTNY